MKIPNKQELQQTAIYDFSDINSKDFININQECNVKLSNFLVIAIFH